MALNDPTSKMSKSIEGSYIAIDDSDEVIRKKIRRAVTDPGPLSSEMGPGVKNLFTLLEAFADAETVSHFHQEFANQTLRYADLKQALAEAIVTALAPIRERKMEILSRPQELEQILLAGRDRARVLAQQTLGEVREAMGFRMPVK